MWVSANKRISWCCYSCPFYLSPHPKLNRNFKSGRSCFDLPMDRNKLNLMLNWLWPFRYPSWFSLSYRYLCLLVFICVPDLKVGKKNEPISFQGAKNKICNLTLNRLLIVEFVKKMGYLGAHYSERQGLMGQFKVKLADFYFFAPSALMG